MVSSMFVPVSPSGTGKTLRALMSGLMITEPEQAGLHQPLQALPIDVEQFLGSFGSVQLKQLQ